MPAALALLLVLAVLLLFWITANIIGVIFTLFIAGAIGWLAESLLPGQRLPYGWLGAILAGLVGSWIGPLLVGHIGPVIARIPVIPAIIGAIVVVAVVKLLQGGSSLGKRT